MFVSWIWHLTPVFFSKDLIKPEKNMETWLELEGLQTDYAVSYLSMSMHNAIQKYLWSQWIPKEIPSATARVSSRKPLKIYRQQLGIYIKGGIIQYLFQCLVLLLFPVSAHCKLQAKLRHTALNWAKLEFKLLPTASPGKFSTYCNSYMWNYIDAYIKYMFHLWMYIYAPLSMFKYKLMFK